MGFFRKRSEVGRREPVQWAGYVCFLPAFALIAIFKFYPLASGIFYSFTNWRGSPKWSFIGIGNYLRMLKDPAFISAMTNAVKVLITLPLWVLIPFLLAFLIFQQTPGWRFFRATFVFPYIIAPVIAGYIFSFVLGLDGPVNELLRWVGLDALAIQWFGDVRTSLWALVAVALWSYFGLGVIIYLAGMATIPRDVFEAATIDGANSRQQVSHIGLPMLLPTIGYWSVICTAGMLIWFFPYIYAITNGGPGYASMLPEYYIYQVSTRYAEPAYASAMGIVLFIYITVVSFVQIRFMYFGDRQGYAARMTFIVRHAREILIFLILGLVAASTIYPLFFVFNTALKTDAGFTADRFSVAVEPTFDNFTLAWERMDFVRASMNSAVTTVGGVIGAWIVCLPVAFAATKMQFPGRNLLFVLILASLLIPIQTILYPFYLVVRDFHLLNQQAGLITAFVTFAIPLTTFQMAAYLRGIPDELIEAARMDGASTLQILLHVIVPVCRPVIAVTGIINFIWMWNDILLPVLIMQKPESRTLMIGAGLLKGQWGSSSTLISAGLALALVPVLVMFLIAQRQIIQGITVGAVK